MSSTLSVYLDADVTHDRPGDIDYIRRLQPTWVRIHQVTARRLWQVYEAAPDANILLRSWDLDDHNGDRKRELYADPIRAARAIIDGWARRADELLRELQRNGWAYDASKWHYGLWNEPDPNYLPQIIAGTAEAMRIAPWPLGVLFPSVGNFRRPDEPAPNWNLAIPLAETIRSGKHILTVHEYWQPEGPSFVWTDKEGRQRVDAGSLSWRHRSIPLDVPILIGESGANGYIFNRHTQQDDGGWQRYVNHDTLRLTPERYAAQVREYIQGCDKRVEGVCLFITDFHSDQWWSFDTGPAHEHLLAVKDARPQSKKDDQNIYLPVVGGPTGTVTGPKKPADMDDWERSIAFVLRWEGGFQNDPADKGNYYNGQLIGTKYGISAASWGGQYDIPNLTLEQAKEIYRKHYWQASGADNLPWPLCLLVFDTAVLHGTGTAQAWLRTVGPNPYMFAAKRLRVYIGMDTWHNFGNAWVRRVADLLDEIGRG